MLAGSTETAEPIRRACRERCWWWKGKRRAEPAGRGAGGGKERGEPSLPGEGLVVERKGESSIPREVLVLMGMRANPQLDSSRCRMSSDLNLSEFAYGPHSSIDNRGHRGSTRRGGPAAFSLGGESLAHAFEVSEAFFHGHGVELAAGGFAPRVAFGDGIKLFGFGFHK
jgi:hypothetical protein